MHETNRHSTREFQLCEGQALDGVSDHLINNSTASFASTSLAGFAKDDANQNQGRLSSFDYVDFILKKGPYEKSRAERPQSWEMINGKNVYSSHLPSDWNSQQPPDAEIFSSMLNHQTLEADICQNCCSKGVQSDLDKITILAQTLNEVSQQAVNQDLGRKADLQPAQVRTVFHEVINDMKKNGARYLQIAKMYEDKYRDLVRRWNQHKEKFKNAGDWRSEGDSRAKIQREFDPLKTDAERNLKKYSFNHQMLLRLERLDEFSKKATQEQKKKFVQLLQCEWEPL